MSDSANLQINITTAGDDTSAAGLKNVRDAAVAAEGAVKSLSATELKLQQDVLLALRSISLAMNGSKKDFEGHATSGARSYKSIADAASSAATEISTANVKIVRSQQELIKELSVGRNARMFDPIRDYSKAGVLEAIAQTDEEQRMSDNGIRLSGQGSGVGDASLERQLAKLREQELLQQELLADEEAMAKAKQATAARMEESVLAVEEEFRATQRLVDLELKRMKAGTPAGARSLDRSAAKLQNMEVEAAQAKALQEELDEDEKHFEKFGKLRPFDNAADSAKGLHLEASRTSTASNGLRASIALAGSGLSSLFGQMAYDVSQMAMHLTLVDKHAGKLLTTVAVMGVVAFAVDSSMKMLAAGQAMALEEATRHVGQLVSAFQELDREHKKVTATTEARQRGVTISYVETERELGKLTRSQQSAEAQIRGLKNQGVDPFEKSKSHYTGISWLDMLSQPTDISNKKSLMMTLMSEVANIAGTKLALERKLNDDLKLLYKERADSWAQSEQSRIQETRSANQQIYREMANYMVQTDNLQKNRRGLEEQLFNADMQQMQERDARILERQEKLRTEMENQILAAKQAGQPTDDIRKKYEADIFGVPHTLDFTALNAKFVAYRAFLKEQWKRTQDEAINAAQGQFVTAAATDQAAESLKDAFSQRRQVLSEQAAFELKLAELTGANVLAVKIKFSAAGLQLDNEEREYRRQLTRQIENDSRTAGIGLRGARATEGLDPRDQISAIRQRVAQEVAAEEEAYRQKSDDTNRQIKLTQFEQDQLRQIHQTNSKVIEIKGNTEIKNLSDETNRSIIRSTEDFNRQIEDLSRTSLDRQIAEEEIRYLRQIEDFRGKGAKIEELEKEHQARLKLIRDKADTMSGRRQEVSDRERLVMENPNSTFNEGFNARAATSRANWPTAAELGAQSYEIGKRGADSFLNSLNSSIQSGDWSGFFTSLGANIESTFIEALTNAMLKKPLEEFFAGIAGGGGSAGSAGGGLISAIGGMFSAGSSATDYASLMPDASVAPALYAKRAMGGDTNIVVMHNIDAETADSNGAKMTQRGAQVVYAKGTGQPGVAAGTLKSRKSR